MDKKQANPGKTAILKKYTGKGGIVGDTIREIPKTVGNAYNNVKNKVQSGITNGIVKFVGDTPAGKILKDGLENQKKGILQNAIKEAKPKVMPAQAKPLTPPGLKRAPGLLKKLPAMPKPGGSIVPKDYKPGSIKRGYTKYA